MAKASTDDQFKFLISCIRYSNNGKVDFTEVAKECNIVSKGAAAKRYERMMRAHGLHQSATPVRDAPVQSRRREKEPKCADSKKRKHGQLTEVTDAISAADDDEGLIRVKDEIGRGMVKQEVEVCVDDSVQSAFFQYANDDGDQSLKIDDSSMFRDFLHSGAFEHDPLQSQSGQNSGENQPSQDNLGDLPTTTSGKDIQESILIAD